MTITTVTGYTPPPELIERLQGVERPILLTHIYPDGDAVGSDLGLYRGLKRLGKNPRLLTTHPAPEKFAFLDPEGVVEVVEGDPTPEVYQAFEDADAIVILDTSDLDRLGRLREPVESVERPRWVIDHHLGHDPASFDLVWAETSSPATGNLVLEVLRSLGVELDPTLTEPLLVALGTDTGWFKFSNASAVAFRAAAAMVEGGAAPEEVYGAVFETSSLRRTQLLGELLAGADTASEGRVAYAILRREMLERRGVGYEETDGFIDSLKGVAGVQIAFLLVELSPGRFKVSLRSKGSVEIHTIAESHGGGGHAKAAGFRIEGNEDEVLRSVLQATEEVLGR